MTDSACMPIGRCVGAASICEDSPNATLLNMSEGMLGNCVEVKEAGMCAYNKGGPLCRATCDTCEPSQLRCTAQHCLLTLMSMGRRVTMAGSDPCEYTNDGSCDVPEYCTSGDFADCKNEAKGAGMCMYGMFMQRKAGRVGRQQCMHARSPASHWHAQARTRKHVRTGMHAHTGMRTHTGMHTRTPAHPPARKPTRTCARTHARAGTQVQARTHTRTNVQARTHAHACARTHAPTQALM